MKSERNNNQWFRDVNPLERVGLAESVSYLDRMIGGGGRTQRQFLTSKKRDPLNKTNNKHHRPSDCNKESTKPNVPGLDLDGANWIADRKKRFPKIANSDTSGGDANENMSCEVGVKNESKDNSGLDNKSHFQHLKSNTKNASIVTRKKTLFEKLMEMD